MAYSPVNNSVFSTEEVGDGADVAQLNDNIEDTRARVATLEALDTSLSKLMYRKSADYPGSTSYSISSGGAETVITLSETQTGQTLIPSTIDDFDILNAGKLDFSGFKFGDKITVKVEGTCSDNTKMIISTASNDYQDLFWGANDVAVINCVIEELADLSDATIKAQRINGETAAGTMTVDKITISINVG